MTSKRQAVVEVAALAEEAARALDELQQRLQLPRTPEPVNPLDAVDAPHGPLVQRALEPFLRRLRRIRAGDPLLTGFAFGAAVADYESRLARKRRASAASLLPHRDLTETAAPEPPSTPPTSSTPTHVPRARSLGDGLADVRANGGAAACAVAKGTALLFDVRTTNGQVITYAPGQVDGAVYRFDLGDEQALRLAEQIVALHLDEDELKWAEQIVPLQPDEDDE